MVEMFPHWRDAYGGDGVPMVVVECTLGFESIAEGAGGNLRDFVAKHLPGHYVTAGITEAEKIRSPLDGEQCTFVKRQWWVIAVSRKFFQSAVQSGNPEGAEACGVASDIRDTDHDRAKGYWFMPEADMKQWREVGRDIGGTFRVAELSHLGHMAGGSPM